MKRLLLSAFVATMISLGSTLVTVASGDSPITYKQIIVVIASAIVVFGKDLQAGMMPTPDQQHKDQQ